jgi:glycosyltransferase involved in cell wall biosynthesis
MSIGVTEPRVKLQKPVRRVLMTSDSRGTVWNYSLDLSRALGRRGVEVVMLSLGKRLSQEQHRAVWSVPSLSVYEEQIRAEWSPDPWDDFQRAGATLLDLEQRYRPDVIHLSSGAHAVLPFQAPVMVHAHHCALSYWRALHRSTPSGARADNSESTPTHLERYRERVTEGLHRASVVVSFTESHLLELEEHYGTFRDRRVIAHGCDPDAYLPDLKEEIIFSAGRLWDPGRNLGALARVSADISWPVYVADDGQPLPAALQTIELQRTRDVGCLGRLSRAEFASWLGRAAIYVQPGRYEPSGSAILEAAFSGCALVLADIPSLRELWEDVAVFVSPDDEQQLHVALNTLSNERSSREALAQAARERAFTFTLGRIADQNLALYDELASRRNSGRAVEAGGSAREQSNEESLGAGETKAGEARKGRSSGLRAPEHVGR